MKKGIFFIPVYKKSENLHKILSEVKDQVIQGEKFGLNEAFFGEHITDRHEKITSSLMMISTMSKLTNKINLGSLTTNLNFYHPSVSSSLISMTDHLTKGRLILGIGSGANRSDIDAIGLLKKDNYKIMLESYEIIKKIIYDKTTNINTNNFEINLKKTQNKKLGLGYFNNLYKDRKNLEIIMPALNYNSYNVEICAKNKWSIAISNFCSDEVVFNHIERYLHFSKLKKKDALKKIKLTKLIYLNKKDYLAEKYLFNKKSPHLFTVKTIFEKLRQFNKHQCFGDNVKTIQQAVENTVMFGSPKKIKSEVNKINKKFGTLGSLIYVAVPKTNKKVYDNSLELFCKYV